MSTRHSIGGSTVTFTRIAMKADTAPATGGKELRQKSSASPFKSVGERTMNRHQFTDLALAGFKQRTAKAEAPRAAGVSAEATEFAEHSRISSDAVHVFATLATDYERTKTAPFDDTHEIAKKVGLSDERTRAAKEELTRVGLLNIRCNDSWGRDSLVPCSTFLDRRGRWR